MRLVSVYRCKEAKRFLYTLLQERSTEADRFVNISHRKMPSWGKHSRFVESRPYAAWYLIRDEAEGEFVGTLYLSKNDEIGIVLLQRFRGQGYGTQAVAELKRRHKRKRYLWNVNPKNERSIALVKRLGGVLLQHTYEMRHA